MPVLRTLLTESPPEQSGARSLRVLLTNIVVSGRTGTEIVTRNIALELLRRGHRPMVYAQQAGKLAEELRRASVPVVSDIGLIRTAPDLIHGQHNAPLATAIARFPSVPAIFVCHDFFAWQDEPPQFPSIRRYVAVDTTVAERLYIESGIDPDRIVVELNSVDTRRFRPREKQLPKRPVRALAYVKHRLHLKALSEACEQRGIALDIRGSVVGSQVDNPERLLPEYDIVFTSALSALEAMACGAAVIVCDARGLAGMVTPERFHQWREANFGLRTLTRETDAANVGAEIDAYDPASAAKVSELVAAAAGFDDSMDRYISLYSACVAEGVPARDRKKHDAAMAQHLQRWGLRYGPQWPWQLERARILNDAERAVQKPPRLRPGDEVMLEPEQLHYVNFVSGFSYPEPWGRWTEDEEAIALFRVEERERTVEVGILVAGYVQPGEQLEVRVIANDAVADTWTFSHPSRREWKKLRVPVGQSGTIILAFHIPGPRAPIETGGNDARRLGLALHGIAFYGACEDST